MARWRYQFGEVLVGLRRNLLMTVAVILSVAVSFTLLGASLLLSKQINLTAGEWTGKIEVAIFLCDDRESSPCPPITDEQRAQLEQDLQDDPIVQQVFFESKQEAYENFQERFKEQPNLLESVNAQTLPASFRVKLQNPDRFAEIRAKYEARPGVEDIVDQRELLEEFLKFANVIRAGAFAIATIQLVAACVLIANIIRVAAFARREQTAIMKLVGASNTYIRLPFVLEGATAGLIGSLVAWLLLLIAVPSVTENLRSEMPFVGFIGRADVAAIGAYLVPGGVGISALASSISLWGFLDV